MSYFSAIFVLDTPTEEFGDQPVHIKIYNNEISVPIRRATKVSTYVMYWRQETAARNTCPKIISYKTLHSLYRHMFFK